jgi:hypothetical protein
VNGDWKNGAGVPLQCMPVQRVASYYRSELPEDVVKEAYKEYAAQYGTDQSLARLNERGGFAWAELAILLYERIKRLERASESESHE